MNWVDYNSKLGISFDDEQKFELLKNKIHNLLYYIGTELTSSDYRNSSFIDYFVMIGYKTNLLNIKGVIESMEYVDSLSELISRYTAFSITSQKHFSNKVVISIIKDFLPKELANLHIQYETLDDEQGWLIIPKGAKELDDALVSQPLEWLKEYPKAHKTFCIALKQYADGEYIRDTADNLRKALEEFLQEFIRNEKNLEANKNEICKYLGKQNVDAGISGLFHPLINTYKNINDRTAKHHDKVDAKLLEFLLYQTGVLIRMVLSVKENEQKNERF